MIFIETYSRIITGQPLQAAALCKCRRGVFSFYEAGGTGSAFSRLPGDAAQT